jgi:hypothetical protein
MRQMREKPFNLNPGGSHSLSEEGEDIAEEISCFS